MLPSFHQNMWPIQSQFSLCVSVVSSLLAALIRSTPQPGLLRQEGRQGSDGMS